MKGFVYGADQSRSVSVYYVSWNGATEVASWDFYDGGGELLGRVGRTGFETTSQQSSRYVETAYAQAISLDGIVLGKSEVVQITTPASWEDPPEQVMDAPAKSFDRSEL